MRTKRVCIISIWTVALFLRMLTTAQAYRHIFSNKIVLRLCHLVARSLVGMFFCFVWTSSKFVSLSLPKS